MLTQTRGPAHMTTTDDAEAAKDEWRPPTEDEIRTRAYELYLDRNRCTDGALDDWPEAEAELWMKRSRPAASPPVRASRHRPRRRAG